MKRIKKAQLFVFDLILSIFILIVSLGIVFSYYSYTYENKEIYSLNNQILSAFAFTKLNSLNEEGIRKLFRSGEIRNVENTVAQQVAEFYYLGKIDNAKNLSKIFIEDYVVKQLNFNLTMIDDTGVEQELVAIINRNSDLKNSKIVSVNRRVIFGFVNNTDYYNNYTLVVKIWQ